MLFHAATVAGFAAVAHATFVLQSPANLGFDASKEAQAPCGGFTATNRTTVTNFPVAGGPIQISTANASATWDIKGALLSNPTAFTSLVPVVTSKGNGTLCLTGIPALSAWANQDGILQVTQHGTDGIFYQCAAVKFVTGAAAAAPGGCVNSTGVTLSYGTTASASSSVAVSSLSSSRPSNSTVAASSTPRPSSSGSAVSVSTSRPASTTPAASSSARTNATSSATSSRPAQFTGAAVLAQNVDVLVGGLAAVAALVL